MITLQFNSKEESVELICDEAGVRTMIDTLNVLLTHGGHEHLMTPSWAGDDLSEEPIGPDRTIINHLRLVLIPAQHDNQP